MSKQCLNYTTVEIGVVYLIYSNIVALMYTKEEVSRLHQKFWTVLGQYMKPIPASNGESINWINYKTGIKHIYLRTYADKNVAGVGIEIRHPDDHQRLYYYNRFVLLKSLMKKTTGCDWEWQAATPDENGYSMSCISQQLNNVNVLNEVDWPSIITFIKPRLIALDTFWETVKDSFD